jgi:dTDP-4-amino-4,6-dideoxygalactose transaminase
MSKLAINGGNKIRTKLFPLQTSIGPEEKEAVMRVMDGKLSGFCGAWNPGFYGGEQVQAFEREWAEKFGVRHAIVCNTATSGLHIACRALELRKGSEVIVTPWSMTCSATAPIVAGAEPIFADVEKDYFCLDYEAVKVLMAKRDLSINAIIAVSLFGQPFDPRLREFGLPIIEDAAQSPGAMCFEDGVGTYTGALGDLGVFSFTWGKHMSAGEGGLITTNDDELAMKCRLIMNHAEAVVNGMPPNMQRKYAHLWGFNMRIGEIQAAIMRSQLRKFDALLAHRLANAQIMQEYLSTIPAITPVKTRPNCTHVYYTDPYLWDSEKAGGLHKRRYLEAVKAELPEMEGRPGEEPMIKTAYITPIYLMPYFQRLGYSKGLCPIAEDLDANRIFMHLYHPYPTSKEDILDVAKAFHKVWDHREELR